MTDTLKWIVHPHSYADKGAIAISVIHESYLHGLKSYGWYNSDKIFVASGTMYGQISEDLHPVLIAFAEIKAAKMNEDDIQPDHERVEADRLEKIGNERFYKKLAAETAWK